MRERRARSAGFSLIELLMVVGIMGLLAGVSVASLKKGGASLTADGNAVVELARLAQQNALVANKATALVLATTTEPKQALGLFQYDIAAAAWTQVTAWKFLRSGVAVNPDASVSTFLSSSLSSGPAVALLAQITKVAGAAVQSASCQVFLPDSQIAGGSPSSPPILRLVQGTLQIQQGQAVVKNGPAADYYDIVLNPTTGRALVDRP